MSSIEEKMQALRLQKAAYCGPSARKYHNAPKTHLRKHPPLPKTMVKPNHYQQNSKISLFSNPKSTEPPSTVVAGYSNELKPSHYSPIQRQHKTAAVANSNVENCDQQNTGVDLQKNSSKVISLKTPKILLNGLDPVQSCYGTRNTKQSPYTLDGSLEEVPKSILSRPSSPMVNSPGKNNKRVTFNLEERPSSASYTPPSYSSQAPKSARSYSTSNTRPVRPSLSEQLSAIADKASDVTSDIRAKAGMERSAFAEKPLHVTPARNFTVGHLQCRYASSVEFFADRFEYKFHHPFQNTEILLVMYFKDMNNVSLTQSPTPGKLIFRVPRHLVHFASDYDPTKHYVVLYLSSSTDIDYIRNNIMPKVR